MLPSSRDCHATTGLEGSDVWGLRPMPTTKGAPSSPCIPHSITAFVFMSTCLPCLLVRRFLFRVPPIPATAATYRQHYRRYRQQYRRYRQHYRWLLPPSRVPVATAAAATTAALASLAAAADRHGCSATSGLTYCRCLCCVAIPPSPLPSAGMSVCFCVVCVTPDDR